MRIMDRLALDVDGCYADFNTPFIDLVYQQTGIRLPAVSDSFPSSWSYHLDGGVNAAQDKDLWRHISASQTFWLDLAPLPTAVEALTRLDKARTKAGMRWKEPLWITSRPGSTAKLQTEKWLTMHGYARPEVIIAHE